MADINDLNDFDAQIAAEIYNSRIAAMLEEKPTIPKINYPNWLGFANKVGTARANKFCISIIPPASMKASSDQNNAIEVYSLSTSLNPNGNFYTEDMYTYGVVRSFPTQKSYMDVTVTFYYDRKNYLYSFFTEWMNKIYSNNRKLLSFYDSYVGYMEISLTDINPGKNVSSVSDIGHRALKKLVTYKCNEIYPYNISVISMASDSSIPLTFEVIFKVHHIDIEFPKDTQSTITSSSTSALKTNQPDTNTQVEQVANSNTVTDPVKLFQYLDATYPDRNKK